MIGNNLRRKKAIHSPPQVECSISRNFLCRLNSDSIVQVKLVKDKRGFPKLVENPDLVMLHCGEILSWGLSTKAA
jgi:hypothetical protein